MSPIYINRVLCSVFPYKPLFLGFLCGFCFDGRTIFGNNVFPQQITLFNFFKASGSFKLFAGRLLKKKGSFREKLCDNNDCVPFWRETPPAPGIEYCVCCCMNFHRPNWWLKTPCCTLRPLQCRSKSIVVLCWVRFQQTTVTFYRRGCFLTKYFNNDKMMSCGIRYT